MAFQPGQSGNPSGRPKTRDWTDAILVALTRKTGKDRKEALAELATRLVNAAYDKGDMVALKEIGDRVEGKPTQAVEHSGNITLTHEEIITRLNDAAFGDQPEGTPTSH